MLAASPIHLQRIVEKVVLLDVLQVIDRHRSLTAIPTQIQRVNAHLQTALNAVRLFITREPRAASVPNARVALLPLITFLQGKANLAAFDDISHLHVHVPRGSYSMR